jgi:Domain of unknown function (DUF4352)
MRTRSVRRGNLVAGLVALFALVVLAISPWLVTTAVDTAVHHERVANATAANHLNQDVRDAGLDFTVHSAQCGHSTLVAGGLTISPTYGDFCVVDVTVRNSGPEPAALAQSEQQATGSRGAVYLSDAAVDTMVNGGNPPIAPGQSRIATLVYDVPPGVVLVGIYLHGSEYSRGVTVRL